MSLLDVDALRDRHLPDLDDADTDGLAVVTALLEGVEAAAARWLGYPTAPAELGGAALPGTLAERDYVLYPRARGANLTLSVAPVTAITSVLLSETADWPGDGSDPSDAVAVASTDYWRDDAANGAWLRARTSAAVALWPSGARKVRVVLTAGYAAADAVPADLADALYRATADLYRQRRTRTLSSSSQGGASQSFRSPDALPEDIRLVLAPYRLLAQYGVC